MIQPAFEILNQRGTPMFFSDTFANIPTAGIVGRIFIRTDSPYGIYRDTGSTWEQIAGSGGGGISGSGAAGQVTFWDGTSSVSGSNNLWFDNASGKFLVGTNNTTGAAKLQVTSATGDDQLRVWGATSPSIRIDNAVSGATQRFVMGLATATNNFIQGSAAGDICISTASASPLLFGMWQTSNASEVMRISTANRILIGTSVDAGAYNLQVTGQIRLNSYISSTSYTGTAAGLLAFDSSGNIITTSTGGGGGMAIGGSITSATAGSVLFAGTSGVLQQDNANFFWDDANNRLGIGLTNPKTSIDSLNTIGLTHTSTSGFSEYLFYENSTAQSDILTCGSTQSSFGGVNSLNIINFLNAPITFYTNNTHKARITSAGRFLLGTTTESTFQFDATQNGRFGTDLTVGTTLTITGLTTGSIPFVGTSGLISQNNSNFFWNNSNSRLGILTNSPKMPLDVFGAIASTHTSTSGYSEYLFYENSTLQADILTCGSTQTGYGGVNSLNLLNFSNAPITFFTNNIRRMDIAANGNILIGSSTNPGQKLYLNGSIRIDGQSSATAGGSAGLHLIVNLDGTNYKIALLNV